jgi:hypothetical protein
MRPDVRTQREKDIRDAGFKIIKTEDTSINTLHSLKLDEKRKMKFIDQNVNFLLRPIAKKFGGCKGSHISVEFETKIIVYMSYII